MRGRRSTIFYDELDQDNEPNENQDYKVTDINLQMKDVTHSDEEEIGRSEEGDPPEELSRPEEEEAASKSPITPYKSPIIKDEPILELLEEESIS